MGSERCHHRRLGVVPQGVAKGVVNEHLYELETAKLCIIELGIATRYQFDPLPHATLLHAIHGHVDIAYGKQSFSMSPGGLAVLPTGLRQLVSRPESSSRVLLYSHVNEPNVEKTIAWRSFKAWKQPTRTLTERYWSLRTSTPLNQSATYDFVVVGKVSGYRKSDRVTSLPMQHHPTLTIVYIVEGEGTWSIDHNVVSVCSGSCLTIPANCPFYARGKSRNKGFAAVIARSPS